MMKTALLFTLSVLLSACTQAGLFAVNSPARLLGDYSRHADIDYGTHGQKLDIYTPASQTESADVVIFFYGGGWNTGSKDMYAFVGDALTQRGYVVIVPDYRKYPDVRFPEFVEDGAQSIAWAQSHIAEYGGDASRIHLLGHSAGAHLGALLASDERYLRAAGTSNAAIRSFAGLAGPYHFIPEKKLYKQVFGPPERYPQMHVDNFIDGQEPPMLLLHGGADDTVEQYNLARLQKAVQQKGGDVRSHVYDGIGHIGMISVFSRPLRGRAPVVDDVDAFFSAGKPK